jgi:hypothetical protein
LHIEELVLHGFEFSQQRAIGDAVERELAQLLAEQDGQTAIGRIGEIAHMDAGAFEINSQSSADTIGIQVARAIYGGFSQ